MNASIKPGFKHSWIKLRFRWQHTKSPDCQVRVENVFIRSKCNEGCSWCIYVIVVTCTDIMIHWCRKGGGGARGACAPKLRVCVPPTFWHLPTPLNSILKHRTYTKLIKDFWEEWKTVKINIKTYYFGGIWVKRKLIT